MNRLALVTWRLPQVPIENLERVRAALPQPAPGVFQLATCQRVLLCSLAPEGSSPETRARELAGLVDRPGGERWVRFDAFRHLLRVASSLDAIAPGEDQVPHQVREAIEAQVEHLGDPLHGILQRVVSAARTVRGEAGLAGHRARSLADQAVRHIPQPARVAVWGTGTIGQASLSALGARGPDDTHDTHGNHVVSRDRDRAVALAADAQLAWSREQILAEPPILDALVLGTRGREGPVLSVEDVERIRQAQPRRSGDEDTGQLTIVDLGMPRNLDPDAARLPGIRTITIEDLARDAREQALSDERIQAARDALEEVVLRERRRVLKQRASERITALREELASDLEALVRELAEEASIADGDLDRWVDRAHGRIAHTSQQHVLAALEGEDP